MDGSDLLAVDQQRQAQVDGVLDRFFSLAKNRAAAFGPEYVRLWEELQPRRTGGKRFRPRMVFCAYQSLGGTDLEAAAYVGAAFELLHTALIVHDDVIDHDFVRRGVPNVSGSYRDRALADGATEKAAEHRGISAAVIAGDLALFNAYRLIDRSGVADVTRDRLVEVMDDALFASAAGELIDVDFSHLTAMPRVDDILTMERLKTAVYSFECPLQAGAILAGASEQIVSDRSPTSVARSGSPTRSSMTCSACSAARPRPARPPSATSARASARCSSPTRRRPATGRRSSP